MTVATKVADSVQDEIDAIKVDDAADSTAVQYEPQAWTREGRVD